MNASEYVTLHPEETIKADLHKSIRSWTITLIIFGGLSFFVNKLFDPGWGIVLITVAILSWKIRTPAMFIIYGVLMGWTALNNIFAAISGEIWWLGLALLQVIWTVSVLRRYKKFCHLQTRDEVKVLGNFGKASGIISIACMVLPPASCLGVFTYILTLGEAALVSPSPQLQQLMETYFTYVFTFANLALLALGLGIAAMTAKHNHKGWAVAGIVMSSIILAGWTLLSILGTIGLMLDQNGVLPSNV